MSSFFKESLAGGGVFGTGGLIENEKYYLKELVMSQTIPRMGSSPPNEREVNRS
jgi:hypothetical protein